MSVYVEIRDWCQVSSSITGNVRLDLSWLGWLAISLRNLPGSTNPCHRGYRCGAIISGFYMGKSPWGQTPGCSSRWVLSSITYWIWWAIFVSIIPLQFIPLHLQTTVHLLSVCQKTPPPHPTASVGFLSEARVGLWVSCVRIEHPCEIVKGEPYSTVVFQSHWH